MTQSEVVVVHPGRGRRGLRRSLHTCHHHDESGAEDDDDDENDDEDCDDGGVDDGGFVGGCLIF